MTDLTKEGLSQEDFNFVIPSNVPLKIIGKILIIGDLHVSDKPSPRHRDYLDSCSQVLVGITEIIKEKGITHVFLLGDIIGRTTEKKFTEDFNKMEFHKILLLWQTLTNGNLYSIKGNHDMGKKLTDFEYFQGVGAIKRFDYVDVGTIRIHGLDYGDHSRELTIDPDKFNVALMHSHLKISGKTDWLPRSNEEIELSSLLNLKGVDLVVCGHIHNPSLSVETTYIDGRKIDLFYTGCPTRPIYDKNVWETCFYVELTTHDEGDDMELIRVELEPRDTFFSKTIFDKDSNDEVEEEDDVESISTSVEALTETLKELGRMNLLEDSSYKEDIKLLGGLDVEASSLALSIIEEVEGMLVK